MASTLLDGSIAPQPRKAIAQEPKDEFGYKGVASSRVVYESVPMIGTGVS